LLSPRFLPRVSLRELGKSLTLPFDFPIGLAAAVAVGRAGAAFGAGAAANFAADSGFFSSLSLNRREKKLPDSLEMLAAGPLACDEVEAATVLSRDGDAARAST